MRKIVAILQIFTILFWNSINLRLALADDSDIFGSNIAPNVMLLIDSSGSMNNAIFTNPYSAAVTYATPLTYNTTQVYRKFTTTSSCNPAPKPCYKFYASNILNVNNLAAQTALAASGYWTGKIAGSTVNLFYGNYLNYLACSSCSLMEPKIAIAKRVLTNLVNNVDGVRFGAMKFKDEGGLVMQPIKDMTATNKTTLINSINTMTTTSVGTVLGEQVEDAGKYYKGNLGYPSPIQYACQPNFVIVISDGLYNGDEDPRSEATKLYTQDHAAGASFPGIQNVIVHTVGFAIDAAESAAANSVLQTMASNGGGNFYDTQNQSQLETSLQDAISQIVAATFSFATPVVPSTGANGSARAYLASFQSNPTRPYWRGFLKAYNRDVNGFIPVDASSIPLVSAMAWDAGQQLSTKAPNTRSIYTAIGTTRHDFTTTNASLTNAMMNASSSTEKDKIINFTRGTDTYDEDKDGNTTEQRPWKLGDIFHSTPVLIQPPSIVTLDASYNAFKSANATRTTVLLAGSNDGMLHAFRETDGVELWGFIPPEQLTSLKDLAANSGPHDYLVDGSPIAADVKIGSPADWKTVVIFGQRRGGKTYYAIDITNTSNPLYMWSFTDSKMGETWSEPVIGKIKMSDGTSKYVALVGGGYDTAANNNSGKAFFVIDVSTGTKLWEYYKPGSVSDDRQYMNFSLAASPTAIDLNNDGHIDRIYIGDVGGQMWKFDVSTPATLAGGVISNWDPAQKGKRFFVSAPSQANPPSAGEYYPAQAIYTPPAVAHDSAKQVWVYFGTGDRGHPNNSSSNRFYGIKDTTEVNGAAVMNQNSPLQESSLTDLTSGTGNVTQGYYLRLSANEKVLSAADVFNSVVLFTTFTPTSVVQCGGGGGSAKLYSVNLIAGDAALNLTTGAILPGGTAAAVAAKNIGTGIPSRPVLTLDHNGKLANPYMITGTTNQQITHTPMPPLTTKRILAWREVF